MKKLLYLYLKKDMIKKLSEKHGEQFIDDVMDTFGMPTNLMNEPINYNQCFKSDSKQLNIAEHQKSIIKSLNDLKRHYPNKKNYRIASSCGAIQYFVDGELVHEVNI